MVVFLMSSWVSSAPVPPGGKLGPDVLVRVGVTASFRRRGAGPGRVSAGLVCFRSRSWHIPAFLSEKLC